MSLRFFADHCVSNSVIARLRNAGHEVFLLKEHIPPDSDDPVVLAKFFFSSRRRHTRSVSAFLLNRSSDLLLLMPTLNFLPVWFALSLLRFRLPSRLPMMFILWMVAMMVVIIPSRTV